MKRVYLAGEGRNDLGGWSGDPAYADRVQRGVIEALMREVRPEGWEIIGAVNWRAIKKYKAGERRAPETRNVLGAALRAKEAGAHALVFVRDRDFDADRDDQVNAGVAQARENKPGLRIAGGLAVEMVEAWLLAIDGRSGSEHENNPKARATDLGFDHTQAMVAHIERKSLRGISSDAKSLRAWLRSVEDALAD